MGFQHPRDSTCHTIDSNSHTHERASTSKADRVVASSSPPHSPSDFSPELTTGSHTNVHIGATTRHSRRINRSRRAVETSPALARARTRGEAAGVAVGAARARSDVPIAGAVHGGVVTGSVLRRRTQLLCRLDGHGGATGGEVPGLHGCGCRRSRGAVELRATTGLRIGRGRPRRAHVASVTQAAAGHPERVSGRPLPSVAVHLQYQHNNQQRK